MTASELIDAPLVSTKASGLHLIDRLVLGYRGAKTLFTAVSFDIFTAVAEGSDTVETLSRRLKTKPRPTRILLDGLAALGFLSKSGERYLNTPISSTYLVASSQRYLGHNLMYQDAAWDCWGALEPLTRTGRAKTSIGAWLARSPAFAESYIRGMDNISERPARAIAELLPLPVAQTLLDIGAGPGAYTRALLLRNPRLKAVLLDLPPSLKVARNILSQSPLRDRITLKPGDYHRTSFGRELYDVIFLSHITHNEDEQANRKLLAKCRAALRPGGMVVIHDFLTSEDGASPAFASLLSLHMLVTTGTGQVYSAGAYQTWLLDAGFVGIRTERVPSDLENPTWLVIGTKV
jgi:ubiquinone/menaquinone biosynthesis C-methylase UbiE